MPPINVLRIIRTLCNAAIGYLRDQPSHKPIEVRCLGILIRIQRILIDEDINEN